MKAIGNQDSHNHVVSLPLDLEWTAPFDLSRFLNCPQKSIHFIAEGPFKMSRDFLFEACRIPLFRLENDVAAGDERFDICKTQFWRYYDM